MTIAVNTISGFQWITKMT